MWRTFFLCLGWMIFSLGGANSRHWTYSLATGRWSWMRLPNQRVLSQTTMAFLSLCTCQVLAGLQWKSCFVFLDDVLVASKTFKEQLQHLRVVFSRFRDANLWLKPQRCSLLCSVITFLGHVISSEGIRPDPAKTENTFTDVTRVRQFLGLASCYRWSIANFAKVAKISPRRVQFSIGPRIMKKPSPSLNGKTFIFETDAKEWYSLKPRKIDLFIP